MRHRSTRRAPAMRALSALLLAAMALGSGRPAAAEPDCEFSLADVPSPPRFADYPAVPQRIAHPAPPRLDSRGARLFRTVIRGAAEEGPNFAGHYTVAVWGCGASCTSAAIIDARSGRVVMPAVINDVTATHVSLREPGGTEPAYNSLRFRPDSRLLVVLGAPNEVEAREGVAFLVWTGSRLRPLRFVSRAALCGAPR